MAVNSSINYSHIVALEAIASDESAASASEQTTTSASYQDACTLTFTPATAGDYIIVAQCYASQGTAGVQGYYVLDVDGTPHMERQQYPDATTTLHERRTQGFLKKVTLTAASHTIKIQWKSNGSATARIGDCSILAMRFDEFTNAEYDEDLTSRGGIVATAPSWTTRHTWDYTPPGTTSGDYLCLAMMVSNGNTHATRISHDELVVGGTTKFDQQAQRNSASLNDKNTYMYAEVLPLSATTTFLNRCNKSGGGPGSNPTATIYTSFFAAQIPPVAGAARRVHIGGYSERSRVAYTG